MELKRDFHKNGGTISGAFIRHAPAKYASYGAILSSNQPAQPFNSMRQTFPDLTKEGYEKARVSAVEFFDGIDPTRYRIFPLASNEARAIETALVYQQVAKEKGFGHLVLFNAHHVGNGAKEALIRENPANKWFLEHLGIVSELGIYDDKTPDPNALIRDGVFNPKSRRTVVNPKSISPELYAKYNEACQIVDADPQASWGDNWMKHAVHVKQGPFPEVKTPIEVYDDQFRKTMNKVKLAGKKSETMGLNDLGQGVKMLMFGHEQTVGHALDSKFGEHALKNCEPLVFGLEDRVIGQFRGKEAVLG